MRWLSDLQQEVVAWYSELQLEKKGIFLRNLRGERVLNDKVGPDDLLNGTIEAVLSAMHQEERDNHLLVQEMVVKVYKMQGWKTPLGDALRRARQRVQNTWGKFPVSAEEKARREVLAGWVANKSEPQASRQAKANAGLVARSLTEF